MTNSTRANGVMDMYRAAAYSVNNYFVQLEFETGMCPVTQMAQRLGVELGTPGRNLVDYYQHVPAFTLGSVEVSPLSMAEAYATFAARGMHCHPIIIDSITRPNGQKMSSPAANCQQVMTQSVADGINKLLSYVMTNGTGRRAMTSDGRPQAGKTGTISSNEAVWFAGYTPRIAGLAMISIDNQRAPFMRSANPDPRVELSGVKGYTVPSTGITLAGTGSSDAGQKIWKPIMDGYLAGTAASPFVEPSTEVTGGPPRQGQN